MGRKSIAAKALAYKQRHTSTKREDTFKTDDDGNIIEKTEITTSQFVCKLCGHKQWFKTNRCPLCNGLQT